MTSGGPNQAKSEAHGHRREQTLTTTILTTKNDPRVRWGRINREWKRCRHTCSHRKWTTPIGPTLHPLHTTRLSPPTLQSDHPPTVDTPSATGNGPHRSAPHISTMSPPSTTHHHHHHITTQHHCHTSPPPQYHNQTRNSHSNPAKNPSTTTQNHLLSCDNHWNKSHQTTAHNNNTQHQAGIGTGSENGLEQWNGS